MKYDFFQEEKLKYEDIEIPDELFLMVRQTVAADRRKKAAVRRMRIIKMAGSAAAILFLCLTIGVNSSYAFAETVVKIPVVRTVAKAVVVRNYRPDIIAVYEEHKAFSKAEETQGSGQPSEEPAPAVSDNDIAQESAAPQPDQTVSENPSEVPEGFEAWKSEMTLDRFREVTELYAPEMEERYAENPEKLRTILLAELPEKDVSLYGYHEDGKMTGTALRVKDTYQFFDWIYMNENKKLPDISLADVNGDGEEEIVVLLYNRAVQKKEISKEDIAAPGSAEVLESGKTEKDITAADAVKSNDKSTDAPDDAKTDTSTETEDISGTANLSEGEGDDKFGSLTVENSEKTEGSKTDLSEETADEETQETISGDNPKETVSTSVSGNDIQKPEKEKEEPEEQAGEVWVITAKENWSAALLSLEDYESQILHQLKAEYDEAAGTVQLYLMEESFGRPVKPELSAEEKKNLTYESINLAPERTFSTKGGLILYFEMEAAFRDKNQQKIIRSVDLPLKADIRLESASLTIENIRER